MPQTALRKILIVDDDKQDVALFRRLLERAGYSVTDYQSGKLGMRAIRETVFDLIILDLNIVDMDGFEVLQTIRREMLKPRILVVSGFMHGELLNAARKLGAVAALDKLVALDLLVPTVNGLFENVD
ncbi:MAG TPA: response regulator [Bryobacteraceae bacterium]|nr:response regulator [Bryobacteraceae bacterium]